MTLPFDDPEKRRMLLANHMAQGLHDWQETEQGFVMCVFCGMVTTKKMTRVMERKHDH